jgi:hypothetical protein
VVYTSYRPVFRETGIGEKFSIDNERRAVMKLRYLTTSSLSFLLAFLPLTVLAAPPVTPDSKPDLEQRVAQLEQLVVVLQAELAANAAADASAHHARYTNAEAIAAVGPHSPDFS